MNMAIDYLQEMMYIARRIRELRRERGLTAQELAYRCDMERSNLSRIESGRTNITLRTVCTICTALGVNLRDVVR